jgi:hypothetical protein
MLLPNFSLNITASVVSWYAAIVSTAIASVQIANYFRDRAKIRISFQRNMEMVNNPAYKGMTLTFITIVNVGRRRLTITNVGARRSTNKSYVFTDSLPRLPHVLDEGGQIQVIVNEEGLDFGDLRCFQASDASGRIFRKNVAPWYRRFYWRMRRWFAKS